MVNAWELIAGASSATLRFSAYAFLRWIPGHHFPPLILSALAIYLTVIFAKPAAFGRDRLTLREAFPKLFKHEEVEIVHEDHEDIIEVVDIDYDDPYVYEDEHPFIKNLLLGVPDWREREFSFITIGVNVLLALLTLDMIFRGPLLNPANDLTFSRVGFVDDTSAKILFREPDPKQVPVYAYYKPSDASRWKEAERTYYVSPETDYTHSLTFSRLQPGTEYEYSLSNNLNGTFVTAPSPTSPQAGSLTFLTSSCIKANFPYRPFSNSLAIHGFKHLSRLLTSLPSTPAFMLFLGDFIYVDVPQRLSSTFSHYRSEYRRVYASPSWKLPGLDSVPWIHTLDDHEIANDWSGGNDTAPFPAASDPFIHYHVSINPPIPLSSPSAPEANTTYFQFTRGPANFFMLDTRRYRTNPEQSTRASSRNTKPLYGSSNTASNPPSTEDSPASMLGATQLSALLLFLRSPEPPQVHWKIIASSVPFTKNWRFGTSDTWGGFPTERAEILAAMHEAESKLGVRVIVLSGDRHEFAAIRFPPPVFRLVSGSPDAAQQETIYDNMPQSGPHEFSVGPLSMFYLPLRTFKQIDDEDVAIAYFPDGNSKIGVVEIQNLASPHLKSSDGFGASFFGSHRDKGTKRRQEGSQQSLLKYSLWIDGSIAWEYTLTSPGPISSRNAADSVNNRRDQRLRQ